MKIKVNKKIIAVGLAVLLVLGIIAISPMPSVLAEEIQSGLPTSIAIGTSSDSPTTIGFGGEEWIVIGYDGTGVSSDTGTMTLLLKSNTMGYSQFASSAISNHYDSSDLKTAMDDAYTSISDTREQALVLPCDLESGSGNYSNPNTTGYDDNKIAGSNVMGANFWPLSVNEAGQLNSGTVRSFGYIWWLRSPGHNNTSAAVVNDYGAVFANGSGVHYTSAIRTAFKLDLSSVIFTSAAASGKSATAGSSLVSASAPAGNLKFTVLDSAQETSRSGNTITFDYSITGSA